jgi:hypothetical protein
MIDLLQGDGNEASKVAAAKLSGDERNSQMAALRSERKQLRSSSGQFMKKHRQQHINILQQGSNTVYRFLN